jgi:hypothetical protein
VLRAVRRGAQATEVYCIPVNRRGVLGFRAEKMGPVRARTAPIRESKAIAWTAPSWARPRRPGAVGPRTPSPVSDGMIVVPYRYETEQVEAIAQQIIPQLEKRAAGGKSGVGRAMMGKACQPARANLRSSVMVFPTLEQVRGVWFAASGDVGAIPALALWCVRPAGSDTCRRGDRQ